MKNNFFKLLFWVHSIFNAVSPIELIIHSEIDTEKYATDQLETITTNFIKDLYWVRYVKEYPELASELLQTNIPVMKLIERRDKEVRAVYKKEMEDNKTELLKAIKPIIEFIRN